MVIPHLRRPSSLRRNGSTGSRSVSRRAAGRGSDFPAASACRAGSPLRDDRRPDRVSQLLLPLPHPDGRFTSDQCDAVKWPRTITAPGRSAGDAAKGRPRPKQRCARPCLGRSFGSSSSSASSTSAARSCAWSLPASHYEPIVWGAPGAAQAACAASNSRSRATGLMLLATLLVARVAGFDDCSTS